jgi:D-alanyl-lipoteichoic acid acyltransferase DltB (MBOAT superfamily)
MLFNSFQFILFYIVALVTVFLLPQRFRWIFLLAASVYFYMCWNPKYIVFIAFLIIVDYFCGLKLGAANSAVTRRYALGVSLATNLGMLLVFKYFNFFSTTASNLCGRHFPLLHLLLPLGISFHVFQSLAYTIDVYHGRQQPEKHFGIYALYVMFFPQLVAGPIERPENLLHQFHEEKHFTYENFRAGAQLALWGMVKKVCIADLLAVPVNKIYATPTSFPGPLLLLATFCFTIQIYCDFSGYTDIARGVAKIMGYDLMLNFRQPYFSRSVREFWQRWHISLSSWFRDFVYFPLGGSRVLHWKVLRNLLIVFLLSGLWHGAAWPFVLWGGLHGIYMVVGEVTRKWRARTIAHWGWADSRLLHLFQVLFTFNLVMMGWVFFRARSLANAWYILRHMYIPSRISFFDLTYGMGLEQYQAELAVLLMMLLLVVDLAIEYRPQQAQQLWQFRGFRWASYASAVYALVFFGIWERVEFIYFQF